MNQTLCEMGINEKYVRNSASVRGKRAAREGPQNRLRLIRKKKNKTNRLRLTLETTSRSEKCRCESFRSSHKQKQLVQRTTHRVHD